MISRPMALSFLRPPQRLFGMVAALMIVCPPISAPAATPAKSPKKAKPASTKLTDEALAALRLGRISREIGDYEASDLYYGEFLLQDKPVSPELLQKVRLEQEACIKLAAGWKFPADDRYDALLKGATSSLALVTPEEAAEKIDAVIAQNPKRWEAYALQAQNFVRLAKLAEALSALQTCHQLGGDNARHATSALTADLERRRNLTSVQTKTSALIAKRDWSSAADLLEKAWQQDAQLVEFGLQAAHLRTQAKDFTSAARICRKLSQQLQETPDHPLASQAALIAATGVKCEQAQKLKGQSVARSPAKSDAPSRPKTESKGSMADKFLKR